MSGWVGSALLLIGSWGVGNKWRHAFLLGLAGELIWTWRAWDTGQVDLFVVCLAFDALYARNWWKWGHEKHDGNTAGTVPARAR
jgi:hypothetical protein